MRFRQANLTQMSSLQVRHHDSPLGRWTVTTVAPHPLLRPIVRHIWHGEGRVAYARDRILPAAQSYLLFNLGAPHYVVDPGPPARRITFDDAWFCGISDRPIDAEAPHGSVVVGVELTTTGAAALLPWRQAELANHIGPIRDLIGAEPARLRERLAETGTVAARLAIVHDWLLARCVSGRQIHPLVHWATGRLADSAGKLRVSELAREAGFSRKHVVEVFRRDVGLGPKTLARLHRFQRTLEALRGGARSFAELALECGYYDQSHLIHDFRQFSGMSPTAFAEAAMPDPKSVVVR